MVKTIITIQLGEFMIPILLKYIIIIVAQWPPLYMVMIEIIFIFTGAWLIYNLINLLIKLHFCAYKSPSGHLTHILSNKKTWK